MSDSFVTNHLRLDGISRFDLADSARWLLPHPATVERVTIPRALSPSPSFMFLPSVEVRRINGAEGLGLTPPGRHTLAADVAQLSTRFAPYRGLFPARLSHAARRAFASASTVGASFGDVAFGAPARKIADTVGEVANPVA